MNQDRKELMVSVEFQFFNIRTHRSSNEMKYMSNFVNIQKVYLATKDRKDIRDKRENSVLLDRQALLGQEDCQDLEARKEMLVLSASQVC